MINFIINGHIKGHGDAEDLALILSDVCFFFLPMFLYVCKLKMNFYNGRLFIPYTLGCISIHII